jgi:hypothetical protein
MLAIFDSVELKSKTISEEMTVPATVTFTLRERKLSL